MKVKQQRILSVILCMAMILLMLTGCKSKINIETRETSDITDTNAFVNGYIDGYEDMPSRVGIYLGTSKDNMERIIQDQHPNNLYTSKTIDVTYDINYDGETELEPETTYYYCFYATVNSKDILGETKSFKTIATADVPKAPVTITTGEAKEITDTNAVLYAHVSDYQEKPGEVGMYLGTSEDTMEKVSKDNNPFSNYNFKEFDVWYNMESDVKMSLEPNTTYYYQAYARIGKGVTKGEVKTFKTAVATEESNTDSNATTE